MPERRESERGVKNKSVRDRGEGEDRQRGEGVKNKTVRDRDGQAATVRGTEE